MKLVKRLFWVLVLGFVALVIWALADVKESEARDEACAAIRDKQVVFTTAFESLNPAEQQQVLRLVAKGDSCGYDDINSAIEQQVGAALRQRMRHPETLEHENRWGNWGSFYMPTWTVEGDSLILRAKHRAQSDAGLTITKYNRASVALTGKGQFVVGSLEIL